MNIQWQISGDGVITALNTKGELKHAHVDADAGPSTKIKRLKSAYKWLIQVKS